MTENELQVYISDMSNDGTWGDGIILSAAVNLYRRPIVIFTLEGEQLIDASSLFESSSDPIRLGLIYSNHYVSIVRRQALCTESEVTFDNEAHDQHQPASNVSAEKLKLHFASKSNRWSIYKLPGATELVHT